MHFKYNFFEMQVLENMSHFCEIELQVHESNASIIIIVLSS
jgi:hypothetical protein